MAQRAVQAGIAGKSLTARVLWYAVRDRNLYLMLLPAFAIFFIFRYVPIFNGLIIPFVDYDLVGGQWASPWVGFKWFRQFFEDPFFVRIIRNTLLLGGLSLVFGFPAPIILALLFNELRSAVFKRVAQTISYLPHFIATVVIVGIIYKLFRFPGNREHSDGGLRDRTGQVHERCRLVSSAVRRVRASGKGWDGGRSSTWQHWQGSIPSCTSRRSSTVPAAGSRCCPSRCPAFSRSFRSF